MPTYEYQATNPDQGCDTCRTRFEVQQAMREDPLGACPACGAPVERVISSVQVCTTPSAKSRLSDKNLKQKGFTKLVNEGGGKFRKVT